MSNKKKLIEKHTELNKNIKELTSKLKDLEQELIKTRETLIFLEGAKQQLEYIINEFDELNYDENESKE